MTTSCGLTVMPEASKKPNKKWGPDHAPANSDDMTQVQELALVRTLMEEHIDRLMSGPASTASRYQVRTGGSLLRAKLALASGRAFGCSRSYRIAAAAACELIHNASLVHDDFLDGDETRRGVASVWKQFGDGIALCAGDLLLCAAFGIAADLKEPAEASLLGRHLTAMTGRVIVGQSLEIAGQSAQQKPGLRAYLEATTSKTVPLIELPLIAGASAGGVDESTQDCIRRLAAAIGLAYQIIDDLDDLDTNCEGLHPFHAWHHHSPRNSGGDRVRISRATKHAIAALNRGRRLLERIETRATESLSPTIAPLLSKLERRALAHSRQPETRGEQAAHDNLVPG